MTDSEKLDLLLEKVGTVEVKISTIEAKVDTIEANIQELKKRTLNLELTLENETNRNIQLLAENHINLIDKLNQSIKVADKTLMFEVQMTSLKSRLDLLEKEVASLKKETA